MFELLILHFDLKFVRFELSVKFGNFVILFSTENFLIKYPCLSCMLLSGQNMSNSFWGREWKETGYLHKLRTSSALLNSFCGINKITVNIDNNAFTTILSNTFGIRTSCKTYTILCFAWNLQPFYLFFILHH